MPPWRGLFAGWDNAVPARLYGGVGGNGSNGSNGANVAAPAAGAETDLAWILQTLVHAERCTPADNVHVRFVSISRALALVEETGTHVFTAEFYRLRGETLLRMAAGGVTSSALRLTLERQAETSLSVAIDLAHVQHLPLWELRATTALCRYYQSAGRPEALPLLASICNWFPLYDASPDAAEARRLLDSLRTPAVELAGQAG